jgi:hypothetical protein
MLQFSLEALACGLARKRANERTERSICGVIGLCGIPCLRASAQPPPRPVRGRRLSAMIRLPIPSVDAVVVHGDGRAERISPTHRLLTGVPPWQRDDLDVWRTVGSAPGLRPKRNPIWLSVSRT